MAFSSKLAATVAGSLLIMAAYAPAFAGSADTATPSAQSATAAPSILAAVSPLLNTSEQHTAPKNCKADSLYSAHDVIGDSSACFISKVDVRAGVGNGAVSGGVF